MTSSGIDIKTQQLLLETVQKIPADYAEIRAEESTATRVIFKGKDPDLIAQPHSLGFFIRVLINGSWGIATFSDIKQLKDKVIQAVTAAKLQGKGDSSMVFATPVNALVIPVIKDDFREISLKKKVDLVKGYNNILLTSTKGIQSTNIIYADSYSIKYFVNSLGSSIYQVRPYIRLSSSAIARNEDVIEMYRDSVGHQGGFSIVEGQEEKMEKVAKEAVELSKTPKVKGGVYTAILDPLMAGTFAHEAFGHFSEADHQYENPKILEQMHIGRKLGSEKVTIVDDPTLPSGWGNYTYDDEGMLGKRVHLLSNGIITSRLHSLQTAAKLNELPNGRARADGFTSKPIVRMSNTFFERGPDSLDDMIKSTSKGILVVNWQAGMTAMESFTFTGMYGVMIENGKLKNKVRSVKLMGNVFETLKNIDAVSNDFQLDQGTCGKQGQSMPVGGGGAYVRVNNITVGGD